MSLPSFIVEGGFNWVSKGYHYLLTESERNQLLSNYRPRDPWQILVRVVELGKIGNFSEVGSLAELFEPSTTYNISPAALLVTGDMGNKAALEGLVTVMKKGPDGLRVYACQAARNAGCIWLVPHMLDAWNRSSGSDAHEQIGYAIADLLDPIEMLDDLGPVAALANSFEFDGASVDVTSKVGALAQRLMKGRSKGGFNALVTESYERILTSCKSEDDSIWAGKRSGVVELAKHFLGMLLPAKYEVTHAPLTVVLRQKLEAATGLNCSNFYNAGRFVQGEAVHTLEEFLASRSLSAFETGVRYFFAHKIF